MKKLLILALAMTVTLTAMAQSLVVKEVERATSDISGSTQRRTDDAGRICALLKVDLPLENVTFKGDVVGKVEFRTGEYWAYMKNGAESITLSHPDYESLTIEFAAWGIDAVRSLQTYLIRIDRQTGSTVDDAPVSLIETKTFNVAGVSFKMIIVNSGYVAVNAHEAKDNNAVTFRVDKYMIAETEVTQELWQAVMGSNPSKFKGPQQPVEMVSWNDCQEFIAKLNEMTGEHFRLPTEVEWQYAANGGEWGTGEDNSWDSYNADGVTHDVKSKKPNNLGAYHMIGNVREWCQDWHAPYPHWLIAPSEYKGPETGTKRIIRGGGIYSVGYTYKHYSQRGREIPYYYACDLGLRLAL